MSEEIRERLAEALRFPLEENWRPESAVTALLPIIAEAVDKAREEGRAEVRERVERSYDHAYDIGDDAYEEGYRHRERQVRTVLRGPHV